MDISFNSFPDISFAKEYISSAKNYVYNNKTAVEAGQKAKALAADAFVAIQGATESAKKFTLTHKKELQVVACTIMATAIAVAAKNYLESIYVNAPNVETPNVDAQTETQNPNSPLKVENKFENIDVKNVGETSNLVQTNIAEKTKVVFEEIKINNVFTPININPVNIEKPVFKAEPIVLNVEKPVLNPVQKSQESKLNVELPVSNPAQEQQKSKQNIEVEQKADLPKVEDIGFTPNGLNPVNTIQVELPTSINQPISEEELPTIINQPASEEELPNDASEITVKEQESKLSDPEQELSLEDKLALYFASKNFSLPVVEQPNSNADVKVIVGNGDPFAFGLNQDYRVFARDLENGALALKTNSNWVVSSTSKVMDGIGSIFTTIKNKAAKLVEPPKFKKFDTQPNENFMQFGTRIEHVVVKKKKSPPQQFNYMSSPEHHDYRRMR